ncbi:ISL3 family transposase [Sapientia aquatica]|uniref:ISL3 family transposase n=1 Tax=Sapientia aquatica TaxID=1549640 RepID=A0A4R5VL05_9BURK|nr:ISL3 family transposase [Sapientia aquatica]TDK58684.1 ISL3 family transposase [Sapientia aquatica]
MESKDLYQALLGMQEPWTVKEVSLDMAKQQVDVFVEHPSGSRFKCPECAAECPVYDHLGERTWRHLDSCQFLTYLHAKPPRIKCPDHGVKQARLPWAEEGSRFTQLFEVLAIDMLRATTVKQAAQILRITWDQAWHLMERAVFRGRAAKGVGLPTHLGVDEKAIAKGHSYMTLTCDLDASTVEYIGEGRTEESLSTYFAAFTAQQLAGIEAISLDMWPAYIKACKMLVPQAESKMVFDRFHIMQHVGNGVDRVRKDEHKALLKQGDTTLTSSKYLWLYNAQTMPAAARERFEQIKRENLKTARAWALKESLRELWSYHSVGWARRFWQRWYFWATHSRLPPMIDKAKLIARHLPNILTYFKHRITNAVAEGLNSKIATVQKRACGFRNRDNFKIAVYFHCGGLDLYPTSATHRKV